MLVFEELLDRIKEKEEKEAKKRQRLADDFNDLLRSKKEITASSNWEDCKPLFEESQEYRSIGEESFGREIFEEYIAHLQEKAKEKERKREEEKFKMVSYCDGLLWPVWHSCGFEGSDSLKKISRKMRWETSYPILTPQSTYRRELENDRFPPFWMWGGSQTWKLPIPTAKKEKEREEKEKRKEKERKEKDRDREREKGKERSRKDETESENVDVTDSYGYKEDKKREKDKDRKHRKRHQSAVDDASSDKEEKEESKKSRRHGSDRKKSRKHAYTPESDTESRHKRHKREHRDGSRRNGGYEELEDGELGEDGEIR
ncbi:Pre-mRNA-processing protein 40A [Vitis vinifera]|uniref:Pre-mRNA-processing protein 40A n=1 Tax=Vitis vinifera TaxID=29760 RepID=A0A438KMJ5_VITVI|nr:Pre-mRNA-processing protein 40A [Vitis vinifera]